MQVYFDFASEAGVTAIKPVMTVDGCLVIDLRTRAEAVLAINEMIADLERLKRKAEKEFAR